MDIEPQRHGKIELAGLGSRAPLDPDEPVEAIFKVKRPGYVPSSVTPRARIDSLMFTGSMRAGDLDSLETDADVESVSVSRRLRVIE